MIKSESLNFQMIHIASELVALAGITFYFTSKHNLVMSEIKKLQNIIQSQQTTIASYNKRFENLQKTIDNLQTQIDTKLSEKNDMFHSQLSMMHDPSFLQSAIIHDNEPLRFPPRPESLHHISNQHSSLESSDIAPDNLPNHYSNNTIAPHDATHFDRSSEKVNVLENTPHDHNSNHDSNIQQDIMETDSQLDAQLSDEFAELQSSQSALSQPASSQPAPPMQILNADRMEQFEMKNKHVSLNDSDISSSRHQPLPNLNDISNISVSNTSVSHEIDLNDTASNSNSILSIHGYTSDTSN